MTETSSLNQLANQLVEMSKITWRKHAWLQYSMLSTLVGLILVALSGWAPARQDAYRKALEHSAEWLPVRPGRGRLDPGIRAVNGQRLTVCYEE